MGDTFSEKDFQNIRLRGGSRPLARDFQRAARALPVGSTRPEGQTPQQKCP